jgi:hypothetical protein
MSYLYRRPTIDASYQVSVHLAKEFQRRRLKCEKLTEDRRRTPSDGKSSHCLRQGELKRGSILYLSTCEFLYPIHYPLFNLYKLARVSHNYVFSFA